MKFVVQKCPFCNGFLEFVAENIVRCLNCDKRFPMIQETVIRMNECKFCGFLFPTKDGIPVQLSKRKLIRAFRQNLTKNERCERCGGLMTEIYAGRGADLSILNMQCRECGHTQRIELNVSDI